MNLIRSKSKETYGIHYLVRLKLLTCSRLGVSHLNDHKFSYNLILSWRNPLWYRNHPLICWANQWTAFYMITASVMKQVKDCIKPFVSDSLSVENNVLFFLRFHNFSFQRQTLMNNMKSLDEEVLSVSDSEMVTILVVANTNITLIHFSIEFSLMPESLRNSRRRACGLQLY